MRARTRSESDLISIDHQPPPELFDNPKIVPATGALPGLEATMHGIIYLVGLIVVIMAILSFFGLR